MDAWYTSHAKAWNDPDTVAVSRLERWALWGPLVFAAVAIAWALWGAL